MLHDCCLNSIFLPFDKMRNALQHIIEPSAYGEPWKRSQTARLISSGGTFQHSFYTNKTKPNQLCRALRLCSVSRQLILRKNRTHPLPRARGGAAAPNQTAEQGKMLFWGGSLNRGFHQVRQRHRFGTAPVSHSPVSASYFVPANAFKLENTS